MLICNIADIAAKHGIDNAHQLARATGMANEVARRYWVGDIPERANLGSLMKIADSLGVRLSDLIDYLPESKSA